MDLGADDYITKPFQSKELIKAIETRLKRQERIIGQYEKVKHELDTTVFAAYYHEFNTPLHGILGGLNLLLHARDTFSEKQIQDLLGSILKSGLRLNHSLANLMLFEEIKRAEVYPELLSMFSNGEAKANWPHKVKNELVTMAKEIYNRSSDLDLQIEPLDVKINPEYLQRMILELVDNALKFSKAGTKVKVTGKAVEDEYHLEISDFGRGFIIESLDQIAPFKQFNRKKYEQQGLGIGLYLVKRIVDFNQGELKFVSLEGEGPRVMITLPLAQQNEFSNAIAQLREA
jgi:signal transduction histidine kinase